MKEEKEKALALFLVRYIVERRKTSTQITQICALVDTIDLLQNSTNSRLFSYKLCLTQAVEG